MSHNHLYEQIDIPFSACLDFGKIHAVDFYSIVDFDKSTKDILQ